MREKWSLQYVVGPRSIDYRIQMNTCASFRCHAEALKNRKRKKKQKNAGDKGGPKRLVLVSCTRQSICNSHQKSSKTKEISLTTCRNEAHPRVFRSILDPVREQSRTDRCSVKFIAHLDRRLAAIDLTFFDAGSPTTSNAASSSLLGGVLVLSPAFASAQVDTLLPVELLDHAYTRLLFVL